MLILAPTIKTLTNLVGGEIKGDSQAKIYNLASLSQAKTGDIAYAVGSKSITAIKSSSATVIITHKTLQKYCKNSSIIVDNPAVAAAKISQYFANQTIIISQNATLHKSSVIGLNVNIAAGCVIGKNVVIGDNCYLYPNVTIMDNVTLGSRCIILSGAVIGSQGFGNALSSDNKWHRIHHFGGVTIGDDVTIGANTTIDNATFDRTLIGNGVKIDNLVHIAHNVEIGENTAIAAKTGIAGSTKIGKNCQIGGMVGIIGHLNITDNVVIHATSTVDRDITKAGKYTSFIPIMPHGKWKKVAFLLTKFDKIAKVLKLKISQLQ